MAVAGLVGTCSVAVHFLRAGANAVLTGVAGAAAFDPTNLTGLGTTTTAGAFGLLASVAASPGAAPPVATIAVVAVGAGATIAVVVSMGAGAAVAWAGTVVPAGA